MRIIETYNYVQWPFTWKRVGGTCFFARWLCTWSTAFLEKDWNKRKEIKRRVIQKCSATSSFRFLYRCMSPSVTWARTSRCFETTTDWIPISVCVWVEGSLITSSPRTAANVNFVPHLKLLPCKGTKSSTVTCCLWLPTPGSDSSPARSKWLFYLSKTLPVPLMNRSVLIQVTFLILLHYFELSTSQTALLQPCWTPARAVDLWDYSKS